MSTFTPPEVVTPDLPEIYYDDACKDYWRKDASGYFMRVNMDSIRRRLKMDGFSTVPHGNEIASQMDVALERIQTERRIFYAGPLAGHKTGVYDSEGRKILVTDSPKLIEPKEGEWPVLGQFIDNLLGEDQAFHFWGWIKVAFDSLRSGKHRPGQALVLTGPKDCGKSLLQKLITVMIGGRVGHPYQYMVEATPFNAHLFGNEHLMIDDQAGSKNSTRRATFGQNLKGLINGQAQHYHEKKRTALSLNPFWRLSISVNDEPEHLIMLPMMDDSLSDKLIILKAERHPMPMPTFTDEERELFFAAMVAELPHALYDMERWDIPENLRSSRFGIKHFHHPEILTAIGSLAPETRLLDLIDCTLFATSTSRYEKHELRSSELEFLLRDGIYGHEVRTLLNFHRACGTYLGRLEKQHPERVRNRKVNGVSRWVITPPERDEQEQPSTSNESEPT